MDDTLNYYNQNANQFVQGTLSVDFKQTQDRFLNKLSAGALILDFGCGSGRDTKYFLEKDYHVDATDGSEELCKLASDYTGIIVKQMIFEELCDVDKYDGIWACSLILHLSKDALITVLKKMEAALKAKGVIYTSFKYGDFEEIGYTLTIDRKYYNTLDIESFSLMMKDPFYCYKFYWLEAIVQLISEGVKKPPSMQSLMRWSVMHGIQCASFIFI